MAIKRKIDKYVEALFQVLPASSYEDIRLKMQKELGKRFAPGQIGAVIAYLRKHVDEYGFTVPHVGSHSVDGEQRYFAVLVEKDGSFYFDPAHRKYLSDGQSCTIKTIATQAANMVVMLDVSMQCERSRARREHMEDLHENLSYVAKRTKRIAAAIDAEIDKLDAA